VGLAAKRLVWQSEMGSAKIDGGQKVAAPAILAALS